MLNKQNPNYKTGSIKEKEEERKQFGKPGNKGEGSPLKPDIKSQQKKTHSGTKTHNKECFDMSEEDEECGSSPRTGSCN